ncbi:MAG: MFS transporter [Pirellulales bacterium]
MSDRSQAGTTNAIEPLELETKPWAPLVIPLYRSFWIAGLFSNLGTWMHETGSQWLMTELHGTPSMVSAVRTAMTLPIFLLALPAGVWADQFDLRRWLLMTQSLLVFFAGTMAILDMGGWMTPTILLVLTACLGMASILNQPAWQSLTPELVPQSMVPAAVAVGSISFNLARSLGPALAGLLIAFAGTWTTFLFNAFSFLGVIGMLLMWKPSMKHPEEKSTKRFRDELVGGLSWVMQSNMMRSVLIRVFCFALPASCLWSLLSLIASDKLQLGAQGFGLLLGAIGGGAVIGAAILPPLRRRFPNTITVLAAEFVFIVGCVLLAYIHTAWGAFIDLLAVGGAWMAVMTTLNATAQVHLPRRVRARGMASYLMAFSCGMAVGSALWGRLAEFVGIDRTFEIAAVTMLCTSLAVHRLPLAEFHPSLSAKG